ncbi:MAG: hypothetical protein J2P37_17605 [Ktedonobacteraceae bacterium]|nr:hypothetical protein [Ktedonobacteraceae bacterium]MBO0791762.1 hypothetical protein [Ktedonobacteraceae bacterium]
MNEETKRKWLKTFLRVYGVLTFFIFGSLSVGFLIQIPLMKYPDGPLNWLIWDDVTGHVGPMLFVIYLVWGAFFFLAANNPLKYRSFLDFTLWANLAHGVLMVPMALMEGFYSSKFLTDIPFILILAIGLAFLRPSSVEVPRVA